MRKFLFSIVDLTLRCLMETLTTKSKYQDSTEEKTADNGLVPCICASHCSWLSSIDSSTTCRGYQITGFDNLVIWNAVYPRNICSFLFQLPSALFESPFLSWYKSLLDTVFVYPFSIIFTSSRWMLRFIRELLKYAYIRELFVDAGRKLESDGWPTFGRVDRLQIP